MGFLSSIWDGLKGGLESILRLYEGLLEPTFGLAAWGISIILLTVTVRIFMIPLMVRQVKSMRAMQMLQPEMKKIQEKYKADRSMMKTDPERYKKLKEKQREAQMALYQEHSVNPVGGCLPLLLQMPIFLALFQVLQGGELAADLGGAPFLGFPNLTTTAQQILGGGETGSIVISAAFAAVTLIVLQVATTFFSTKQMMARNKGTQGAEQAQAQKIMLYVMPVFLGFLSYSFPIGVVLYWVTTNFWTMGQQAVIFRKVEAEEARLAEEREAERLAKKQRGHIDDVVDKSGETASRGGSKNGKAGNAKGSTHKSGTGANGSSKNGSSKNGSTPSSPKTSPQPATAGTGVRSPKARALRASTGPDGKPSTNGGTKGTGGSKSSRPKQKRSNPRSS
jgi:YidC/Oxa1 family membrane protein insertase